MARQGPRRGRGEGSVTERKDGRWAAYITLDNGKRKYMYAKTKKAALDLLKKAQLEQMQGTLVTSTPRLTVAQFFTQWIEWRKPSLRIRSYERYEGFIRLQVIPHIGNIQLRKLTLTHLQSLYSELLGAGGIKGSIKASTVNTLHWMINRALSDAVKWELIAKNPCKAVEPPRRARYEFRALTVEEAQRLLAAARGHGMEALFVLALTTGMRRGELLALKWQDIDFELGAVHVRRAFTRAKGQRYLEAEPKTEKSRRSILLAPGTIEILKQHRLKQLEAKQQAGEDWEERDLVFCTAVGTPLNPNKVLERFGTLLKRAGLPHIRLHDLRHSFASMMLKLDIHPKIVQELLGHSRITETLDIYSHVLPTMQEGAMHKLNNNLQWRRGEAAMTLEPDFLARLSLNDGEGGDLWEIRLGDAGELSLAPSSDPQRPLVFDGDAVLRLLAYLQERRESIAAQAKRGGIIGADLG
jgi:integrase